MNSICIVGILSLTWILTYFYDISPYELILYHGIMLIMAYSWTRHVQVKYKSKVQIVCTAISVCLSMIIFDDQMLISAVLSIMVQQLMVNYYERV